MILDSTTAAAAYGLRKLRTAYAGNCITVRRSSDNTTQAIGFSGDDLDTASLLSFCGAGNGFTVTWHDQSGSGFDVTQPTNANQPQIVSGGSLITQGGRPTMLFDSTDFFVATGSALGMFQNVSYGEVYSIARNTATTGNRYLFQFATALGNNRFALNFGRVNANRVEINGRRLDADSLFAAESGSAASNNLAQFTALALWASSDAYVRQNGVQVAVNTSASTDGATSNTASSSGTIGTLGAVASVENISEVILFNTDQSSNRAAIELEQMIYYGLAAADIRLVGNSPLIQSCRLHSKLIGA